LVNNVDVSTSLVQQSAKIIPKQLLQNKQMLGFLSYACASFHISYSIRRSFFYTYVSCQVY